MAALTSMFRSTLLVGIVLLLDYRAAYAAACPPSPAAGSSSTVLTVASATCTVNAGSTVNVIAGSTATVTMSGGTAVSPTTLINAGTIQQSGSASGRAVVSSGTNAVLVIQNNGGAVISTVNNDTVAAGTGSTTVSSVSLTNAGTIQAFAGGQAVNFNKILSGTNTISNTGSILAAGSDAVRPGVAGVVTNSGTIQSTQVSGSSSDGIDLQNNSLIQITNSTLNGLIDGGRHGITGGPASDSIFTIAITNNSGATIRGSNGSGINLDGFSGKQVATIVNAGTITGNGVTGDGDGVDMDGLVNLTNSGVIRSFNAFSAAPGGQSEGISVGGGTIINSGTIEGLVAAGNANAVGRGISLLGNDIVSGPLAGTREAIYGNTSVTNNAGGLIRGDSDSGIAVDGPASGFTVQIHNDALATIRGGGTANAAIRTGFDNDTIYNSGIIDGSSGGKAINMGGGNNALYISGGSASILGDVNGGSGGTNALDIDPGAGNSFSYAGAMSNFAAVEIDSGLVTLTGANTYTGSTILDGGTLRLDGTNRLAAVSSLLLNGGTLQLANAASGIGQAFSTLSLTSSSGIDLGFSALSFNALGTITAGKSLSLVHYSPALALAFRILGDYTNNSDFLSLMGATTVDGAAALFHFDGVYTDVNLAAAPVPLPASAWLLLSGILGMLAIGQKRISTAALSS